MSADKYAQFIAEQQHKLSVSGTNAVELTEKKHMSKADIAALKEPKDKFDEKDLEALRNKEHLKKEEVEQIDERDMENKKKKDVFIKQLGNAARKSGDPKHLTNIGTGIRNSVANKIRGRELTQGKNRVEEVELISIEEQAYLEEMVGKGKLADILMHHKDNMNHHREMAKHHSDMYDKSMEVGDSRGAGHHEEEGMHHEMQAQHHQARYDHAAGLKAQMNAKREMKAAQSAMDAARKKISAAKQDKKDW